MAASAVDLYRPLGRREVEAAAAGASAEIPLSLAAIWLPLGLPADAGGRTGFGVCRVVMVREGGFMIVVPAQDTFRDTLAGFLDEEGAPLAAFHSGSVQLVSGKGRELGVADALLVDLPWDTLPEFAQSQPVRGAVGRKVTLHQFRRGSTIGVPVAASVLALAEEWLGGDIDPDTAEEYATGVEMAPEDDAALADGESAAPPAGPGHDADVLAQMQKRLLELEAELNASKARGSSSVLQAASKAASRPGNSQAGLFGGQADTLSAGDWQKLQLLAGQAPGRTQGALSRRPVPPIGDAATNDGILAEVEKGAIEDQMAGLAMPNLDEVTDPVQRLLIMQMQQNTLLMQRVLAPKDTMASLLTGGSGSESGANSTGARGCMAREVFLRTIHDLPRIAEQTRDNALKELGIPLDKEDGFLMRKYLERRVPLQDQKLLAHVGTLVSEGWAIAHLSNNLEMKGFLSRMMFFIEQAALDSGRLELAWLLTGFTEPNSHLFFPVKRTPGLKPFSRLANPLWLSANLAYLRDLDYLQSRAATVGKGNPKPSADTETDKRPKPKPAPKAKGKKGGQQTSETPEAASV